MIGIPSRARSPLARDLFNNAFVIAAPTDWVKPLLYGFSQPHPKAEKLRLRDSVRLGFRNRVEECVGGKGTTRVWSFRPPPNRGGSLYPNVRGAVLIVRNRIVHDPASWLDGPYNGAITSLDLRSLIPGDPAFSPIKGEEIRRSIQDVQCSGGYAREGCEGRHGEGVIN